MPKAMVPVPIKRSTAILTSLTYGSKSYDLVMILAKGMAEILYASMYSLIPTPTVKIGRRNNLSIGYLLGIYHYHINHLKRLGEIGVSITRLVSDFLRYLHWTQSSGSTGASAVSNALTRNSRNTSVNTSG